MSETPAARESLAELIEALAREVGPHVHECRSDAARARGRQRTVRRRLTASLLATVLLAGGIGVAVAAAGHRAASPRPVTGSPTSAAKSNVDPTKVVDAAWLAPDQLPFAAGHTARMDSNAPQPQVFSAAQNDLGTCLSGDPEQVGAGPRWQNEAGSVSSSAGTSGFEVYEVQYFYQDASAAQHGLAAFESVYAHCQGVGTKDYQLDPHLLDTVQVTVNSDGRFAMLRTVRHPDGTAASSGTVGSDSHEYLVQDGNVVYFLGLYNGQTIDSTTQDAHVLTSMYDALEHYWP